METQHCQISPNQPQNDALKQIFVLLAQRKEQKIQHEKLKQMLQRREQELIQSQTEKQKLEQKMEENQRLMNCKLQQKQQEYQLLQKQSISEKKKLQEMILQRDKIIQSKQKEIKKNQYEIKKWEGKLQTTQKSLSTINSNYAKLESVLKSNIQEGHAKIKDLEMQLLQLQLFNDELLTIFSKIESNFQNLMEARRKLEIELETTKQMNSNSKKEYQHLYNEFLDIKFRKSDNPLPKLNMEQQEQIKNSELSIAKLENMLKREQESISNLYMKYRQQIDYQKLCKQLKQNVEQLQKQNNGLTNNLQQTRTKLFDYIYKYDKNTYENLLKQEKPEMIQYFIDKKKDFQKFIEKLQYIDIQIEKIMEKINLEKTTKFQEQEQQNHQSEATDQQNQNQSKIIQKYQEIISTIRLVYINQIKQILQENDKQIEEISKVKKNKKNAKITKKQRCCHCLLVLKTSQAICEKCMNPRHINCLNHKQYFSQCTRLLIKF